MLKPEGLGESVSELIGEEGVPLLSYPSRMVTVTQHAGTFAFWQQNNHLFPYGSVVPCQWHSISSAATSNCTPPVKQHSINGCSPYVSPLLVQQHSTTTINTPPHHYHHYFHLPVAAPTPVTQGARTVDPDKPIGYGSFGVVWWVSGVCVFLNIYFISCYNMKVSAFRSVFTKWC